MTISFTFRDMLLYQTALFVMLSPFSVIGPFAALSEGYSRKIQISMAFRISLYLFIIIVLLSLLGNTVLDILGISIESLSAAGGLVLIVMSLNMILKGDSPRRKVKTEIIEEEEDWRTLIATPMLFPLTIGAGTISLVLTQAGAAVTFLDKLLLCLAGLIDSVFVFFVYFSSAFMTRKIGNRGNVILTRVGGMILLSLAFSVFTRGLKVLLPGLAG